MTAPGTAATKRVPDPRLYIFACTSCADWQIDITPRAVSGFGGAQPAIWVVGEAHADHILTDCPGGTTGRVKVSGRWVERMRMTDGKVATGMLEASPLPAWWVWR